MNYFESYIPEGYEIPESIVNKLSNKQKNRIIGDVIACLNKGRYHGFTWSGKPVSWTSVDVLKSAAVPPVAEPEPEGDPIVRTLNAAADLIEEYGWVRNQYGNKEIGFCITGAIEEAAGPSSTNRPWQTNLGYLSRRSVGAEINRSYNDEWSLVHWNDRQTDRRKVVRLLRRAARNHTS